ncbi:TPA: hypothetical protein ACYTJQ_000495 [Yersinia enterocolitica]|nr:hypothetical protein [Yersinia enterocolitica]HEC1638572.1 hypothetical protein [Yersinia enterocolitica]
MTNIGDEELTVTAPVETKFWVHQDGWIYVGDQIEGARAATEAEIDEHLAKTISTGT